MHGRSRSVTFHPYPQLDVEARAPLAANLDNIRPITIN